MICWVEIVLVSMMILTRGDLFMIARRASKSGQTRHRQIEQENVRLQFERLGDRYVAILGLADDLKAGLILQHVFYAEAHHRMIVSDNDTNRRCRYTLHRQTSSLHPSSRIFS